ncbi:hypothetical protein BCR42DRAFT_315216 [Absidia repens]|uniref:MADS-box domain-containing protein n=1 Tax=Absidia repens TaxID=90262 RepID=A0A1X2J362_9FUNG|nr:hypothetical protein BCR42DRAFT_315216 [Absidia repens]
MDRLGVNKPHEDCSTGVVEETRHKGRVRGKVNIEYIEDIKKRRVTFSKRKAGIMKKAYELSELTGTEVLLLVVSETERVHSFSTSKLLPIVTKTPGKELIQECLNTPDEMVQFIKGQPETGSLTISLLFLFCRNRNQLLNHHNLTQSPLMNDLSQVPHHHPFPILMFMLIHQVLPLTRPMVSLKAHILYLLLTLAIDTNCLRFLH